MTPGFKDQAVQEIAQIILSGEASTPDEAMKIWWKKGRDFHKAFEANKEAWVNKFMSAV